MEIKLEIGENLRQAIETIVRVTGTEEDLGKILQDAFRIDFTKLIKEHAEGGDMRLEVKDIRTSNYDDLRHALSPFIGIKEKSITNAVLDMLIIIGKGIYRSWDWEVKATELEKEIQEGLNNTK